MARFSDSVWRRWTFIFFRGLRRFDGLDFDADGGEPLTLGEDASRDVDDDDDGVEEEEELAILSGSERTFRTCRDGRPGEMDNDVVRGDGGRLSRILALVFVLSKEEGCDATVCRLDMQPGGVNAEERAREDRTHKATVVRARAAAYVLLLFDDDDDDDDKCRWSAFASVCSWSPGRFRRIL